MAPETLGAFYCSLAKGAEWALESLTVYLQKKKKMYIYMCQIDMEPTVVAL